MSVTCQDIQSVAQRLLKGGHEAEHRSCISRAYYASYHFALEWESRLPCGGSEFGPQGGVHQKLVNRLANPGPLCTDVQKKASKLLSYQLNRLKSLRHGADYELQLSFDSAMATQAFADAGVILATP